MQTNKRKSLSQIIVLEMCEREEKNEERGDTEKKRWRWRRWWKKLEKCVFFFLLTSNCWTCQNCWQSMVLSKHFILFYFLQKVNMCLNNSLCLIQIFSSSFWCFTSVLMQKKTFELKWSFINICFLFLSLFPFRNQQIIHAFHRMP